ncbi:MAG: lysophospholipid acyltransferase family protein [Gammaproteobacteria bacterium]|jgi:1-acyl-sn-glycerol-3-phosphate acyltransferase
MFWVWLFIIKRYQINNFKNVYNEFKSIKKQINGPLIICPNHLTYIDSVLLIFIFGSMWDYICNFHTLAWNFPTTAHLKDNLLYKIICYLGKCIFFDLNTSTDQPKKTMQKAKYLLSRGEYILLFPEGHRSTNGLVDTKNFAYGVGKLINEVPNVKVLCVYLRGSSQKTYSIFPNEKDRFYCKLNLITPITANTPSINTNLNNLRSYREISKNIIQTLYQMEQDYFFTDQYA